MRLVTPRRTLLFTAVVVATIGLACSDSTAPLSRRIAGTYNLTTDLQSYTYSAHCLPTANGVQCTDTTVAAGPSKLYGTFTLAGTDSNTSPTMTFAVSAASFHQAGCASSTAPCSEIVAAYSGSATVSRDSLRFLAPLYGGLMVVMNGTVVGDEIRGQIDWHTYLGCCARQYYSGTFVAKRQR